MIQIKKKGMPYLMEALVLAGGTNKRFGATKSFIKINNCRIIDTNIKLLQNIFMKVLLSTNDPEQYFYLGVPMVGDIVKDKGPMAGILSALMLTDVNAVFVTACDMPCIHVDFIRFIKRKWTDNYHAVIPVFHGETHPLFGVYSKEVAGIMEKSMRNNMTSLRDFLREIKVLYIQEKDVKDYDPEGKSFININTKDDFRKEIGGEICLV